MSGGWLPLSKSRDTLYQRAKIHPIRPITPLCRVPAKELKKLLFGLAVWFMFSTYCRLHIGWFSIIKYHYNRPAGRSLKYISRGAREVINPVVNIGRYLGTGEGSPHQLWVTSYWGCISFGVVEWVIQSVGIFGKKGEKWLELGI